MDSRAVFITGATGKQGGAVIDAILKAHAPYEILALIRDAQSASSLRLLQRSDIGFLGAEALMKNDDLMYKNTSMSLTGEALSLKKFEQTFEKTTGEKLPTTYGFLAKVIC